MMSRKFFVIALVLLMAPAAALAQSSISGQVTDNTGGVLPGVTVEASSPDMIEGSRVVVTDGTGQYNVTNLRPGTFSVTFTLPGFGTQVRDELVLAAGFAMDIDVAMSVGALEESVTVSGESPVVDVQQVQRTEVLTREVQEALPTGRSTWSYASLIPGVKIQKPDVGGISGAQQNVMFGRGANVADTSVEIDGLMVNTLIGDGGWQGYFNPMMTAETSYTTSGITAETQLGGLRINMIPQEGGNQFSGSFFGGGTSRGMQGNNFNDRLQQLGVANEDSVPHVARIYDFNGSVGGPIVRDKLWFFSSARRNVLDNQVINSFKRDGSPGIDDNSITSAMSRLTWQINERNKFSIMFDKVRKRRFHVHGSGDDWQTSSASWTSPHYDTGTAKWTSAVSSRMLLEFGMALTYEDWDPSYQEGQKRERPTGFLQCLSTPCFPAVGSAEANLQISDEWYSLNNHDDNYLGVEFNNNEFEFNNYPHRYAMAGSMSYVTGSHNFKVGMTNTYGSKRRSQSSNSNLYQVYNAVPNAFGLTVPFIGPASAFFDPVTGNQAGTADEVLVYNDPTSNGVGLDYNGGIYAQDSWTIDKLTMNYGARMDWAANSIAEQSKPGGRFTPDVFYPEVPLPSFGPDISPRLSVAYDVFGNAQTALKASFGRYYEAVGAGFPERYTAAIGASDRRDWFDAHLLADGSGASGLNPYGTNNDNIAQDWEIGPLNSSTFGTRFTDVPCSEGLTASADVFPTVAAGTSLCDRSVQRMYNDMITIGISQEVADGISVSLEWRRRAYHDSDSGDNPIRNFSDYGSSIFLARPAPFLGSIEVFNIDPSARTRNLELDRTRGDGFRQVYQGLELSANARLPNGGTVFGGWTMETEFETDDCQDELDRSDNPNNLRFCDQFSFPRPYKHEFKVSAVSPVTLPGLGDLSAGMAFIGYPGGRGGFDRLRESFIYSRSSSTQFGSVFGTYGAPFYTAESCAAAGCTIGAPYIDRGVNPTINTSTGSYTALMTPGESVKFLPYWAQLDVNIAKVFNLGGWRYDVRAELFNALNAGFDLSHGNGVNNLGTLAGAQSSANYEQTDQVMDSRVFRIAVTARF